MKTIWTKDAYGKIIPIRDVDCYTDDGFGNLIEAAGIYYNEHPTAPMLHKDMRIVNYVGALYFLGLVELNNLKG
jgi:hypothetical protein